MTINSVDISFYKKIENIRKLKKKYKKLFTFSMIERKCKNMFNLDKNGPLPPCSTCNNYFNFGITIYIIYYYYYYYYVDILFNYYY